MSISLQKPTYQHSRKLRLMRSAVQFIKSSSSIKTSFIEEEIIEVTRGRCFSKPSTLETNSRTEQSVETRIITEQSEIEETGQALIEPALTSNHQLQEQSSIITTDMVDGLINQSVTSEDPVSRQIRTVADRTVTEETIYEHIRMETPTTPLSPDSKVTQDLSIDTSPHNISVPEPPATEDIINEELLHKYSIIQRISSDDLVSKIVLDNQPMAGPVKVSPTSDIGETNTGIRQTVCPLTALQNDTTVLKPTQEIESGNLITYTIDTIDNTPLEIDDIPYRVTQNDKIQYMHYSPNNTESQFEPSIKELEDINFHLRKLIFMIRKQAALTDIELSVDDCQRLLNAPSIGHRVVHIAKSYIDGQRREIIIKCANNVLSFNENLDYLQLLRQVELLINTLQLRQKYDDYLGWYGKINEATELTQLLKTKFKNLDSAFN